MREVRKRLHTEIEGRRESKTDRERKGEGVEGIAGMVKCFQWKI